MKEQKVGFDSRQSSQAGGAPGSASGSAMPGGHRPDTAKSAATTFTIRSMVQSEHRYM